jgi:ketose-bisphosphate aldolase
MEAVIEAAANKKAAVIIQTSVGPAKFFKPEVLAAAYRVLAEKSPYPVCLHLDHCTDPDFCKRCADAGYTNIMIDASKEPFEKNLAKTRDVADHCHKRGDITVEGELGTVVGVEDDISVKGNEVALCDPSKAEEFVSKTGIDLFAPAIGTAHGMYKSAPKIDFALFEKIAGIINGRDIRAPLVIHGGTGLSEEVTRRLVSLGGAKFNVSTELKHALIDASFNYLKDKKDDYNPGKLDAAVYEKTVELINRWIDILGSGGRY